MNPLLEAAKTLGDPQLDDEQKQTKSESGEAENGVGSYERFMSSFGMPQRWAGR